MNEPKPVTREELERWLAEAEPVSCLSKYHIRDETAMGRYYREHDERVNFARRIGSLIQALVLMARSHRDFFDAYDRISQTYNVVQPGIALTVKHSVVISTMRELAKVRLPGEEEGDG